MSRHQSPWRHSQNTECWPQPQSFWFSGSRGYKTAFPHLENHWPVITFAWWTEIWPQKLILNLCNVFSGAAVMTHQLLGCAGKSRLSRAPWAPGAWCGRTTDTPVCVCTCAHAFGVGDLRAGHAPSTVSSRWLPTGWSEQSPGCLPPSRLPLTPQDDSPAGTRSLLSPTQLQPCCGEHRLWQRNRENSWKGCSS